ncbi:POLZ1 [Auxenochlorella protothecoides x Auxenochlorella symbiontica]
MESPLLGPSGAPNVILRIVNIEYYLAPPIPEVDACWSSLEGSPVTHVPVVRIYGSTPQGQKACLHVHQAFPYFYVPYHEDLPQDADGAGTQLRRLGMALEAVLSMSTAQAMAGGQAVTGDQGSVKRRQHIFDLTLVAAKAFYGYHAQDRAWVKISLYNPQDVRRAATLLQTGAVLGRVWQPHEAHVPYLLQFKIDFNLFGMGHLVLSRAKFREPLPCTHSRQRPGWAAQQLVHEEEPVTAAGGCGGSVSMALDTSHVWTTSSTPRDWVWAGVKPPRRQTVCELELDAVVDAICNRHELVRVPLAQVPSEKRMVESLASMWAEESERSGGAVPRAPPSPPRHPASLCEAVAATRAGFQAVADAQRADIRGAEEATPVLATPPPPARVALLALTQPANLSALGASPAARASALRGAGGAGLGPSPLLARLASPEPGDAGVALVDTGALAALFSRLPPAAGARGQAERQARRGDLGAAGSGSDVEEDGRGAPGDADEDDADEDMLLRLAAQGAVLGTQFTPGLEGGHPVSRGGRTPLAAPAEEHSRTQTETQLREWLVASQREVQDILMSQALTGDGEFEPDDGLEGQLPAQGSSLFRAAGLDFGAQAGGRGQPDHAEPGEAGAAPPTIPQIDGAVAEYTVGMKAGSAFPGAAKAWMGGGLRRPSGRKRGVVGKCGSSGIGGDDESAAVMTRMDGQDPEYDAPADVAPSHPHGDTSDATAPGLTEAMAPPAPVSSLIPQRTEASCRPVGPAAPALVLPDSQSSSAEAAGPTAHAMPSLDLVPASLSLVESPGSVSAGPGESSSPLQAGGSDAPSSGRAKGSTGVLGVLPHAAGGDEGDVPGEHASAGAWMTDASQDPILEDWNDLSRGWDEGDSDEGEEDDFRDGDGVWPLGAADAGGMVKASVIQHEPPPPSQAELDATAAAVGCPLTVNRRAFFSNPADVPGRVATAANRFHWLTSDAVSHLPAFQSSLPHRPRAELGASAPSVEELRRQRVITPAQDPPGRASVEAWQDARGAGRAARAAPAGLAAPRQRMDPNTGQLVVESAALSTAGASQGAGGADDLLATPMLCTLPSQRGAQRASASPAAASPLAVARGGDDADADDATVEGEEEEEEVRPASPKYDERTFFFSNPFATQQYGPRSAARAAADGAAGGHASQLRESPAVSVARHADSPESAPPPRPAGVPPAAPEALRTPGAQRPVRFAALAGAHVAPGTSPRLPSRLGQPAAGRDGEAPPAADTQGRDEAAAPPGAAHSSGKERVSPPAAPPSASPLRRGVPPAMLPSMLSPAHSAPAAGDTPLEQTGFKRVVDGKGQQLTLLSVEVHAESRGLLLPDPRHDAVRAVFLVVMDDDEEVDDGKYTARILLWDDKVGTRRPGDGGQGAPESASPAPAPQLQTPAAPAAPSHPGAGPAGCATPPGGQASPGSPAPFPSPPLASTARDVPCVSPGRGPMGRGLRRWAGADALTSAQVDLYASEAALLDAVVEGVRALDPDILLGFEVQCGGLGYLNDRAAALGDAHYLRALSRTPELASVKEAQEDEYGWLNASGLHIAGRIVLNVWRIMRAEVKLNIYTLEAVSAAVLQLRVPHIPQHQLHAWYQAGPGGGRWRCLEACLLRARLNLSLLDRLDVVGRTSELARAFGIDFFSVLSRGSQYRVESMMLRLAHTQNFLALAPSKEQVARQPAMEIIPLVMEPESRFYADPVIVLDFQSLYPSMIIAYNLCYSTCIGRVAHAAAPADKPIRLGCSEYALPHGTLLEDGLHPSNLLISPNGIGFVPPSRRPGVLPRLLSEILDTRVMVKGAMKRLPPAAKVLLRCLNARQFGLKLIANVTYGYTSAGFSGRMPMAEIADAIVSLARATLENAIDVINKHPDWGARVVYGDTDSMFVVVPGKSREAAFKIGAEIQRVVTAANPSPILLKLEKVYHPCVLLTKKRYVGFAYESHSQATPAFDAKGIETVRRDTCPAVAKMMERSLRLLFTTKDLSQVKQYCERQWTKILSGRVSIQDFVFAKEVRLGTYSARHGIIPPAALIATRAMSMDPRAEPRFGERVQYLVVHGAPGARLIDMVVPPSALVEARGRLRLHALYYITKQIVPALDRVFALMGVDVRAWFAGMPRPGLLLPHKRPARDASATGGSTIDRYYLSRHCAVCDELTAASRPLCPRCTGEPQLTAAVLAARLNRLERQNSHLLRLCAHCGGGGATGEGGAGNDWSIACTSADCGLWYERRKAWHELQTVAGMAEAGAKQLADGDEDLA